MAKYLTEQVDNGTPYNDILEVHNRLIAVGKAIRFFYHFIKDYTVQLANKYNIDLDWTGIPDDVEFNHDWLQEGDVVDYLNDLVDIINKTKDMLYVALSQWTEFFKHWLDNLDEDNDSLSDMVVGDNDIHNKPGINYDKLFVSWNTGDVVYAEDFNQVKEHAYNLIQHLPRIFGAYYHLIELESLDTKSNEFGDYGATVTDSALTFSSLISDWTKVDPTTPEEGATVFYSYYDGQFWNAKVVVWKSEDESAHRFMIWDYFKQEYVFDTGWYPAQSFPSSSFTGTNFDSRFLHWDYGPYDLHSVYLSQDKTKVIYSTLRYGKYNRDDNDDDGMIVGFDETVLNLETNDTEHKAFRYIYCDEYVDIESKLFELRGRTHFGVVLKWGNEDNDDSDEWTDWFYTYGDHQIHRTHLLYEDRRADILQSVYPTYNHDGTYGILFKGDEENDDGHEDYYVRLCKLTPSGSVTYIYGLHEGGDSVSGGMYGYHGLGVGFGAVADNDHDGDIGVINSRGTAKTSFSCGNRDSQQIYDEWKLRYGIAYGWCEWTCNYDTYYRGAVLRMQYPKFISKGYTQNKDGNHPVQWTAVDFTRTDNILDIQFAYPEIKWLLPYKLYYNIQNPRVFEDTTTIDSTNKACFVAGKYFVPETWYGVPVLETPDSFAREDGTLPIRFHYWGLDDDKLSTYDTLIVEIV